MFLLKSGSANPHPFAFRPTHFISLFQSPSLMTLSSVCAAHSPKKKKESSQGSVLLTIRRTSHSASKVVNKFCALNPSRHHDQAAPLTNHKLILPFPQLLWDLIPRPPSRLGGCNCRCVSRALPLFAINLDTSSLKTNPCHTASSAPILLPPPQRGPAIVQPFNSSQSCSGRPLLQMKSPGLLN